MIYKDTFRYGLYAAVAAVILALTAVFGKFHDLIVMGGQLSLSYVILAGFLVTVAYVTSSSGAKNEPLPVFINGIIGSAMVGLALALLVLIESSTDLTFVFPDL